MKKQNFQEIMKQKQKIFNWPVWFPYPTSWLKALTLTMFLRIIIFVVEKAGKLSYHIVNFTKSMELFVISSILIILSPNRSYAQKNATNTK